MLDLVILSIFRQSESYLQQYLDQVNDVFDSFKGRCGAVWLEGDSIDKTFETLTYAKDAFDDQGYEVNLKKYDCNGPYWKSVVNNKRWLQLSTCWNKCLEYLPESKYTVCVESDIKYEPIIIGQLIDCLDNDHHVIFPMLMIDDSSNRFYDTWGFSKDGKKFQNNHPYYPSDESGDLMKLTSGGGMIVSTYEHQKLGKFNPTTCIMQYPESINLYLNKSLKAWHPVPK